MKYPDPTARADAIAQYKIELANLEHEVAEAAISFCIAEQNLEEAEEIERDTYMLILIKVLTTKQGVLEDAVHKLITFKHERKI